MTALNVAQLPPLTMAIKRVKATAGASRGYFPTRCARSAKSSSTKFNIDSTPTLVFADGAVVKQYVGAEALARLLNDTPK